MSRLIAGIAVLAGILCPQVTSAQQCLSFSKDIPCVQKDGPLNRIDFGTTQKQTRPQIPKAVTMSRPPQAVEQQGIDCAMLRWIDREHKSAMRVVRPDPTIKYAMRLIVPLPCKAK